MMGLQMTRSLTIASDISYTENTRRLVGEDDSGWGGANRHGLFGVRWGRESVLSVGHCVFYLSEGYW
jgi:1,4-dihydroxy-2-naphthoyl-CoA synthase